MGCEKFQTLFWQLIYINRKCWYGIAKNSTTSGMTTFKWFFRRKWTTNLKDFRQWANASNKNFIFHNERHLQWIWLTGILFTVSIDEGWETILSMCFFQTLTLSVNFDCNLVRSTLTKFAIASQTKSLDFQKPSHCNNMERCHDCTYGSYRDMTNLCISSEIHYRWNKQSRRDHSEKKGRNIDKISYQKYNHKLLKCAIVRKLLCFEFPLRGDGAETMHAWALKVRNSKDRRPEVTPSKFWSSKINWIVSIVNSFLR